MPVAPSYQDLLDQFQAMAQSIRPELTFREGDITVAQQHGAAAMADAVLRYAIQAFRDTFIDGAEGDALTARVDDQLNLQRNPATSATVTARFTRTSGGGAGTIPIGTVIATAFDADGEEIRFETTTAAVVPLADNGPFDVQAEAVEVGRNGDVDAGTIVRIVSSLFDTSFSVTNVAAAGGGNEQETDQELRLRARNFYSTLRRGTLASLEAGALTVPAVRIAKATEDPTTGLVTVVVTDADGNSTLEMVSDVETELENWRAAGVIITVIGGTPLTIDITFELNVADGVDAAVLVPLVAAALEAKVNKLRQGQILYEDQLTTAGCAVDPDGIESISFSSPTFDTDGAITPAPTSAQVIRPGTITGS
jgi:baseplate J-like protein